MSDVSSGQVVQEGTPETTYYRYDAAGNRVRKVTEGYAAVGQTARRTKERLYVDGFELYREYDTDGTTVTFEWETLPVHDDRRASQGKFSAGPTGTDTIRIRGRR